MKGNNESSGIAIALEGCLRLITEQSKQTNTTMEKIASETNKKLTDLTIVVKTLAESVIRAEERHEQYNDRFNRLSSDMEHFRDRQDLNEKGLADVKADTDLNTASRTYFVYVKAGATILVIGAIIVSMLMKGGLTT